MLALDWTHGLSVRHYSSAPLAYPPGGAKPIVPGGEFHARVIEAGEPRFCADADAIRAAFPDHALILSLGCESAVNVPVRWNGRTLGSLNLLHEAGWYGEDMLPVLRVYGAMAVPLLQQIHLDRSHDHTTTGKHHEHQASAGRAFAGRAVARRRAGRGAVSVQTHHHRSSLRARLGSRTRSAAWSGRYCRRRWASR